MSELIILLGIGRAGKTTFAETFEQKGYKRISIDKHFKYNTGMKAWRNLVDCICNLLNKNPNTNYVLDGYINACTCLKTGMRIYTGHGFDGIQANLNHHMIKPIVVVQSKKVLYERGSEETEERISWLYAWFLTMRGIDTIVVGSKDNCIISSKERAMSLVLDMDEPIAPTKVGSQHILERLKKRKIEKAPHHGDPYYQTIELTDGLMIQGYNRNYEHTTWDMIKEHLDVKNKRVAEVGCHHGFYLLKIKEQGASVVHGYDFNPWTVESANQIAHFRELNVDYMLRNIDTNKLSGLYDIILVMNTDHHFHDPEGSLRKIFSRARECVLIETQDKNRFIDGSNFARVSTIAEEFSFKEHTRLESKRKNRIILLYRKNK